jgi:hypothetical protein
MLPEFPPTSEHAGSTGVALVQDASVAMPPFIGEQSESDDASDKEDASEKPEEDGEISASVREAIVRRDEEDGAFT